MTQSLTKNIMVNEQARDGCIAWFGCNSIVNAECLESDYLKIFSIKLKDKK